MLKISKSYTFKCKGHSNIRGTHKTTLEFTKDKNLTPKGDCIIGLECGFSLSEIKKLLPGMAEIELKMKCPDSRILQDNFKAIIISSFGSEQEMIFRKTSHISDRTVGIESSKAAKEIDRKIIDALKSPEAVLEIKITKTGNKNAPLGAIHGLKPVAFGRF